MVADTDYEVIIIGGSYAGLSAAMALGRSMRKILIIDSDQPCNKQTPYSHNFITQDGETPAIISSKARKQVLKYPTASFIKNYVTDVVRNSESGIFEIRTKAEDKFKSKKVLFATGVRDIMPEMPGYAECWGISILHCPYCHGYEIKNQKIGLIGNGDMVFHMAMLIYHWSNDLVLFTNGKSTLTAEQHAKITGLNIEIIETEIESFKHNSGKLDQILLKNGNKYVINAMFAKPAFEQHCDIPQKLGCELTEDGYLKVSDFQETSIAGIYAAGDNTTMFRAVSVAVASGTKAGALMNKALIDESYQRN